MKLVFITDVHANLPALRAALAAIRSEGYDALVHGGDAIAIGPSPKECLEMLLGLPSIQFIMGNHDRYFSRGLPVPQPSYMSDGEVEHQHWTHAQLDPGLRAVVARWPYRIVQDFAGTEATFVHYPLTASGEHFTDLIRNPAASDMDGLFAQYPSERSSLFFYGHNHNFSDLQGRARYVNPGSLGCAAGPVARYAVVEFDRGGYRLEHRSVPYDDRELFDAFERRQVPERHFIYRAFLGGRFQSPTQSG
jgi:predicted phosphodiesterase